ncbi:hypothetical protein [Allokutzneria oryzae]|uniref:Uncharacterized protein n=1 Tax=Allokutzneria oryzae TaxID=1378989 RepID=A0ABV5ZUG1_9PSEU
MSIAELRAAFEVVLQHLGAAGHHARGARERLTETHEVLDDLSRDHQGSLVPPELAKATDMLERVLAALAEGSDAVESFSSAL